MKLNFKTKLNESGQGMSEYLILVMLIAVGSIIASQGVGKTVIGKLEQIKESIDTTVTLESVRGKK